MAPSQDSFAPRRDAPLFGRLAIIGIGLADQTSAPMLAVLMLLPLSSFEATAALPDAATSLTRAGIAARRLLELTGDPHILDAPEPGRRSDRRHHCLPAV